MDINEIFDLPIVRLLWFLAIVGVFFYRDLPKAKWKIYQVLLYWTFILFFGYFGIAGMMTAGMAELFVRFTESSKINPDLADQLTITSLCLLFLYRLFSRYVKHDESTTWLEESIKGIVTSYVAFNLLFYAFLSYLSVEKAPKLEAFSFTLLSFIALFVVFISDLALWVIKRETF